jgi:ribonuclease HI
MLRLIDMYTDGASSGNPGPGGYGVILKYKDHIKELSGGFRKTTNNRMELKAVIEGLKSLKEKCKVNIYSDSKYIVDAIEQEWIYKWKNLGWRRNKKQKLLNPDLWKELFNLLQKHKIKLFWIKGHSAHPENERCDYLAVKASQQSNLPPDEYFESSPEDLFIGELNK